MPSQLSAGSDHSRLWIQPILFMITGAAAAYALMSIHSHYSKQQRKGRPTLRRRNAVRRNNRSRRDRPTASFEFAADLEAPIRALDRLEQNDGSYGQWQVYVHDWGTITGDLIPRDVVMPERVMGLELPEDEVLALSRMIELAFVENFLIMEIPPGQTIDRDGEVDYIAGELSRRGLNPQLVISCLQSFSDSASFRQTVIARRAAGLGTAEASVHISTPFEYGSQSTYTQNHHQSQQTQAPLQSSALPLTPGSISSLPQLEPPPESSISRPLSPHQPALQPLSPDDQRSDFSFRDELEEEQPGREGQNLLNLLYHIADDQSRKDGYIHRGVTCNSCSVMPIQGIRYRCANCIDYDLCESCEALQVHNKMHIFYKIRVPAPFLGNPRQVQPVVYPGKPDALPPNLSRTLTKRLISESGLENSELEALWDQFRCLANTEWPQDPNKLGLAINRKTFDKCFVPNLSSGPPTPSLIYDRMFAYYDTNDDGLIGFEEFLKGLSSLSNQGRNERLKRTFDCYDIDRDGYIERKDILRVFRAYYVLTRELTRETIIPFEDEYYDGSPRDVVTGAAPISSAFSVTLDPADSGNRHVHGRNNEGKRMTVHGDLEIVDGEGIFKTDEDLTRDRDVVIGNTAVRDAYHTTRPMQRLRRLLHTHSRQQYDEDFPDDENDFSEDEATSLAGIFDDDEYANCELYPSFFNHHPPPWQIQDGDIVEALGAYIPLDEVTDPVDRARIGYAAILRLDSGDSIRMDATHRQRVQERWERRQFYTDEEDGSRPPLDWNEDDGNSDHDDSESVRPPPSPRSRSSSKVRFQDDVTDNEYDTYDTRSNASSRSIPVAERWGGFEIPQAERDVGKEVLYQVTQEGINELLNPLFKSREDLMMEILRTRSIRRRFAKEINEFVDSLPDENPLRTEGRSEIGSDDHKHTEKDRRSLTSARIEMTSPEDDGFSDASVASSRSIRRRLPDGFVPIVQHTLSSGLHPHPGDTARSEYDPDPTLPQNRPDTPDLQELLHTPLSELGSSHWGMSSERPRLTHQNAEGSLSAGRSLTPDQALGQEMSQSESSSRGIPMASFELDSSHVAYADREDIIPIESSFSHASDQPSHSSHQSSNPQSFSNTDSQSRLGAPPSQRSMLGGMSMEESKGSKSPPPPAYLERLAKLNQAEREAEKRDGNAAKLSFKEFSAKLQGDKSLDFLSNWIDVTSF